MEISQQTWIKDPRPFKRQDIDSSLHRDDGQVWDQAHTEGMTSWCPIVFKRHTASQLLCLERWQPNSVLSIPLALCGGECGNSQCMCRGAQRWLGGHYIYFQTHLELLVRNFFFYQVYANKSLVACFSVHSVFTRNGESWKTTPEAPRLKYFWECFYIRSLVLIMYLVLGAAVNNGS